MFRKCANFPYSPYSTSTINFCFELACLHGAKAEQWVLAPSLQQGRFLVLGARTAAVGRALAGWVRLGRYVRAGLLARGSGLLLLPLRCWGGLRGRWSPLGLGPYAPSPHAAVGMPWGFDFGNGFAASGSLPFGLCCRSGWRSQIFAYEGL